jgi:hypothetical protein
MKIIIKIVKKSNDSIWENQANSISFKSFHSKKLKESSLNKSNKFTNNKENPSQICHTVKNTSNLSEPILMNKSYVSSDQVSEI